ncbi:uncharacterized protein cfap92 [Mugil cephalus]|uniref:uncharacterized protein cfap92 n=1 Tax=Mugil cephalus TaxID=48193 RepID=UPI001FB6C54F|nr:uncharacterized protein cfap92 [Mugil cephalus]
MESATEEADPMASAPDKSLDLPQRECDDGEVADKRQEDVLVPEADLLSEEQGLETRSVPDEDITAQTDDGSYYVTWSVYIALAIPQGEDVDASETPEKGMKANKDSTTGSMKAHKAQSSFHIEYKLLPDDTETAKVDVVVFGPVAKMYKADECKILRTWREGDQTWVGWSQNFNVRVNRDTLISLLPRKIRLQIWNSKDKLSSQAGYERLKALRLPQDQSENAADVCGEIKTMVNKLRSMREKKSNASKAYRKTDKDGNLAPHLKKGPEKHTTEVYDLEDIKKTGTASVEINPICLVAGDTSLTERFLVCSSGVLEVMCNISLDKPLMSDQLKTELNPLVITIVSATSMPSSPVPFHVLQERCMPVYCQYKFDNFEAHRTSYHKHDTDIYFKDVNVILTGLMNLEELQEFFSGPPLEIEVHDRDRKSDEAAKSPSSLGSGSDNANQRRATLLTKKMAAVNTHGVACLNLSDLLLGKKSLEVYLPIKSRPPPLLLDRERSRLKKTMTDAAAPVPQGHYYDANSQLKVKAEIAYPLNCKTDAPFGRIIYQFAFNNSSAMTKLRSEILQINAAAFHLGSRSLENIQTALSNYKMNFKHEKSKDLDFVTGFHVLDTRTHIFVLEGLQEKAVKRLWEAVPMKLSGSEEEHVIVLYNSNLGFFRRMYDSLDVGLSPVHLCEPLKTIMRKPLIYIRGVLPQPCFQALSRLSQLCRVKHLKEVVQYNLFPSADMILSLNEEYGTRVEQWEQKAGANTEKDLIALPVRMKRHAPLDTHNKDYDRWKHNSRQMAQQHTKNFIQENVEKVHEESEQLQKPDAAVLRIEESGGKPAHNYSIQTFNSNEQNKDLLRTEMAKVPWRRFTYSQQYHSATVDPGDVTLRSDSAAASTVWVTSMNKPKVHPRHPDEARVEELRKPWRENVLHANTLKPTLSRDMWAWDQRSMDFQLCGKPTSFFSTPPMTIHLTGESLQQEQLRAARAQYDRWLKKLLPGGSDPPADGPVPEFKCHMRGHSERLQDLLKDEPRKYSLRKAGMMLEPFPQLSVMNLGEGAAEERMSVALAPGDCTNCSLSSKNNVIPRHAPLPSKCHHT